MNNKKTGAEYEEKASRWLTDKGMCILERNFRCRQGEIDIIGRHEGYLVFLEVKYRSSKVQGYPEEAVTYQKQKKICRCGDYYRAIRKVEGNTPVRYDVLAILQEDITWYRNAFMHAEEF